MKNLYQHLHICHHPSDARKLATEIEALNISDTEIHKILILILDEDYDKIEYPTIRDILSNTQDRYNSCH